MTKDTDTGGDSHAREHGLRRRPRGNGTSRKRAAPPHKARGSGAVKSADRPEGGGRRSYLAEDYGKDNKIVTREEKKQLEEEIKKAFGSMFTGAESVHSDVGPRGNEGGGATGEVGENFGADNKIITRKRMAELEAELLHILGGPGTMRSGTPHN